MKGGIPPDWFKVEHKDGPDFGKKRFILTTEWSLVNRADLQALVGPTVIGLVKDPLAAQHLDNPLYI